MPVLYLGRNVNHISRVQFLSGFAPLLIITPTRRTKKDLTAVMVDVPVVPATGLKGHVGNRHAHITQGAQITGPALPTRSPSTWYPLLAGSKEMGWNLLISSFPSLSSTLSSMLTFTI